MELLVLVSSAKYIAMRRGGSILFQVVTRTRNSLIRPAVRYSIPDKHDPAYHMFLYVHRYYILILAVSCALRILRLFSTHIQKFSLRFIKRELRLV